MKQLFIIYYNYNYLFPPEKYPSLQLLSRIIFGDINVII